MTGVQTCALPISRFCRRGASVQAKPPRLLPLAIPLALYPPVYYLTQNFPRYRYPILWISFLLSGYAIAHLLERLRKVN